jgi:hypothetical protein
MKHVKVDDSRECKRNPSQIANGNQSSKKKPIICLEIPQTLDAHFDKGGGFLDSLFMLSLINKTPDDGETVLY